jgi:hypothetical protein
MSILHYFGKVNTKPKKYEGDLPQYTGYVYKSGPSAVTHCLENETKKQHDHVDGFQRISDSYLYKNHSGERTVCYTYQHGLQFSPEQCVFSFTTLAETFSKCFEKVREKMYSDLWKTIGCCPFINIMDLLLLKQSDTDKHIEHLEQMMCSLMEDNKLLQNRINALETKRAIPVTVGELLCDA